VPGCLRTLLALVMSGAARSMLCCCSELGRRGRLLSLVLFVLVLQGQDGVAGLPHSEHVSAGNRIWHHKHVAADVLPSPAPGDK